MCASSSIQFFCKHADNRCLYPERRWLGNLDGLCSLKRIRVSISRKVIKQTGNIVSHALVGKFQLLAWANFAGLLDLSVVEFAAQNYIDSDESSNIRRSQFCARRPAGSLAGLLACSHNSTRESDEDAPR